MALDTYFLARPFVTSAASERAAAKQPKRGFFARLRDGLVLSRQRQADREIARLIELRGGKFTDDLEREAEQVLERRVLFG